MKLLWLTKTFPYPSLAGDTIYTRHLIEGCAKLGASIHVVCHPGLDTKNKRPPRLAGLSWDVLDEIPVGRVRAMFSVLPNLTARFGSSMRWRHIRSVLQNDDWDAIIFDGIGALAPFDAIRRQLGDCVTRPLLVYISHNHEETTRLSIVRESRGAIQKMAQLLDMLKTRFLERRIVARSDLLIVNTEADWTLYERHNPGTCYLVVRPAYDGTRCDKRNLANTTRTVLVLGSYIWVAKKLNLEVFLREAGRIFPAAGIRLRVAGHMERDYQCSLALRFPWADIVGPVENVDSELQLARIGIIPEQAGGGFKHKLLNYVFQRVPVAALSSAVTSVPLHPNEDYISEQTVSDLVRAITDNIDHVDKLQTMADVAYAKCDTDFNWNDRCRDLIATLLELKPT